MFFNSTQSRDLPEDGETPTAVISQNYLGNLPSWEASGKHNFCICLLSLLLIAWPSTPGCPDYPVVCEREGGLLSRPYSVHEWNEAGSTCCQEAGSRAQAWAIKRECGLVAAELGVDLTVTRLCTLVERRTAERGWFQWVVLTEGRLGAMGTQKWAVL